MNFGLSRVRELLDKIGSPDLGLKIAHIAGTNGKGSIAEYLTCILDRAGKRVGTFTSPAVMSEWDQFRVNGLALDPLVMGEYLGRCYELRGDCTAFEVLTASALLAFKEQGCEYAVVECGLGGSSDATNAIMHKEVAIISSIGLEHTAILGDTIEKICAQKAGIVKDCPLVVNALQCDEAKRFFERMGASFAAIDNIEVGDKQSFCVKGTRFEISPLGIEQAYNAAAAVEAARILGISDFAIASGLAVARPIGRIEVLHSRGNTYIVDGAHNPQAIEALTRYISERKMKDVKVVFGCFSDKDIASITEMLGKIASSVTAVQPPSNRALKLDKIVRECKRHFSSVAYSQSVSDALDGLNGTIVVCGSFTLVKEALNWIEKEQ